MKNLTLKLILPLTIISFASITKWWYALPVDARDTLYWGFPFPFVGEGWHTSMSLQLFVLEFLADFLVYFLFWFLLLLCVNTYIKTVKTGKLANILLWVVSGIFILGASFILYISEPVIHIRRPYEMEIVDTGIKVVWKSTERPEYPENEP